MTGEGNKLMKFLKKLFNKFILNIPKEVKKDFNKELVRSNYEKLAVVSIVFFAMELIMYIFPEGAYSFSDVIFYFLISNIFLIPIIILMHIFFSKINIVLAHIMQNIYALSILLFGIFMSLKYQNRIDFVHIYLMAVMCIVCFIYLSLWNRLILFGLVYILFIILLPYYQPDWDLARITGINALIFNVLAFFLADMRIKSKLNAYINSKKLEYLAERDSMTGLYNHEAIYQKLNNEIKKAKITKKPLALFMLDVDNFKVINDTHGHVKGDWVIKEIAQIIIDNTEKNAMIGRYGGDEFMIISPDTKYEKACSIIDLLKSKMTGMIIPVEISIGMCLYSDESLNEFVKKADKKLYETKNNKKKNNS